MWVATLLVLSLGSSPGPATVTGRVTLGGLRPAGGEVWVTRGGACPRTVPDDRIVAAADGSLADAVVLLVPEAGAVRGPARRREAEVRALYCDLRPRVQVAPAGSRLEARAEPGADHRLHAYREGNTLWGGRLQPGDAPALSEAGVIDVRCDAGHEWEVAWIYVTDAPYFAVTDRDGRFAIAGIPGGRYTLRAWHPYLGHIEAPITVDPMAPSGLTVSFSSREAIESLYPGNTVEVAR